MAEDQADATQDSEEEVEIVEIECITTKKGFYGARRYRAGDPITYKGPEDKMPGHFVPKEKFKAEPAKSVMDDTGSAEGTGGRVSADSAGDLDIGGDGNGQGEGEGGDDGAADGNGEGDDGGEKPVNISQAAAQKIAELNINAEDLTGTGQNGQITMNDVNAFIKENQGEGGSGEGEGNQQDEI